MTKRYRGWSDSQANAEALARRDATYSAASGQSFRVRWDFNNREPKDLRECVRMARAAYADEVPARLHNRDLADDGTPHMTPQAEGYIFGSETAGSERIGKCECKPNTPSWDGGQRLPAAVDRDAITAELLQAMQDHRYRVTIQGVLFTYTDGHVIDCPRAYLNREQLDFYRTPFKAALALLRSQSAPRAEMVLRIAVGENRPIDSAVVAAISVGVPTWCAYEVAEATLRSFLRNLTDIKVHLPKDNAAA